MAYAGFSNGPNGKRIYSIQSKFNVPNGDEIRAQRALSNKSRPISNGPAQLITEVWKVEAMLDLISSDCAYEDYRNLIWTIESLNWDSGYELAYNWSITTPDRFDKNVLDRLIEDYKPGHFSYGTIVMHAKKAGWDELAWLSKIQAWENFLKPENFESYIYSLMTEKEKSILNDSNLNDKQKECYLDRLKIRYMCIHYLDQSNTIKIEAEPRIESSNRLIKVSELGKFSNQKYLIKGLIPATGISACYGASGSGKSFLISDLGINLAFGNDWYGRKVKKCPVTFIVLEGAGGLSKRFQAWEKHFGQIIPENCKVFIDSFALTSSNDVSNIVSEVNNQGQRSGLIVIDTLNQASPGADENNSKDMSLIIQNAQRLARETHCHVMLVHHTGKDASKGLRGHSSLIAALDVAIEVKREGSRRSWSISKSKDDTDTGQYHFELNQIVLGHDQDGDQISSCVIEPAIQTLISSKQKRPQGAQQKIALDAFNSLKLLSKQSTPSIDPKLKLADLEKAVGENLAVEEKRKPERARAAINGLIALGLLTIKDGFITNT